MALGRLDWRGRLHFVPLQAFAAAVPTREELLSTLHVRDAEGRWSRGGDAALRIAGVVPALLPLATLGRLPGVRRVVDTAYGAVADHRGAISRALELESCAVGLRAEIVAGMDEGGPQAALASVFEERTA